MQYRQLGRSGVFVSRLALGTAQFGGADHPLYRHIGGLGQAEADRLVGMALDAGINLFDSADVYAQGESEQRLGRALGSRRHEALISTKVGNRAGPHPNDAGLSRVHLVGAIDAALRRLGTDHIDLLQIHAWDPYTPLEDVMRTLGDAVRMGKVRYLGCSNFFAWQLVKANLLAAAHGMEPLVACQAYYSLVGRDIEREILPALQDQGLALLSWAPLAGGLLSGEYSRSRRPTRNSRRLAVAFPPVDENHAFNVIDVLEIVARKHAATVAQVALAWQFHQPGLTAAVVGANSESQLGDNLRSVDLALTTEDLGQLDAVSRLPVEYPRWYQNLPLGRLPGEASGVGRTEK